MASVIGATVEVQANASGNAIFEVQDFLVLAIGGRDVSNGQPQAYGSIQG